MRPTTHLTSTAVMQRRVEPHTSLDYFPTQPWAVRALCEFLRAELGEDLAKRQCWEPACGEMHMARVLAEYFAAVRASDVFQYGGNELVDFVGFYPWAKRDATDWIVTNPPFQLAEPFIKRALRLARRGVVMVVRSAFTEGDERYEALFRPDIRPAYVVSFVERVVLLRGRLIRTGAPDPFNYDPDTLVPRKASTATALSLVIWLPGQHDTRHRWIPKCRVELERDEDFPAYTDQWALLRSMQAAASDQGDLLMSQEPTT